MPTSQAPSLSNLQTWMRWVLTHPDGVGAALRQPHPQEKCLTFIGETASVSREKRLSIYGNGYFGRIVEVLGANFSSVKNVVGAEVFDEAARKYLTQHPSTFKSVDDIGAHLAAFLKRHPLSKKFPFLPDLAEMDWAAHRAFFADDMPLLKKNLLRNIPEKSWAQATVTLDPSGTLLKLDWPVDGVWRSDGEWTGRKLRSLKRTVSFYLVFRSEDKRVRVWTLSPAQFGLLDQLKRKKTFQKSLLLISNSRAFKGESLSVGEWFQEWVEAGIIKKISI